MIRWGALVLAALVWLPTGAPLSAQTERTPVYLSGVEGPSSGQLRNTMTRILRRERSIQLLGERAARTRVGVFQIRGRSAREAGSLQFVVEVYGPDETLIGDVRVEARNSRALIRTLRSGLWTELEPLLEEAPPPPSDGPMLNVVLRDLLGPGAIELRQTIESRLRRQGGVNLLDLNAPMTRESDYVRVAREHEVAAFLEGDIERGASGFRLVLVLRSGASGQPISELRLNASSIANLRREVRDRLWAGLGEGITSARPPEPEAEAPAPAASTLEEDILAESPSGPRPSPLHIRVGARLFNRSFTYNDDLFSQLSGYRLGIGPEITIETAWYPLAHFLGGPLADLGLDLNLALGAGISTAREEESLETQTLDWSAGLLYRMSFGSTRLRAGAGVGAHRFAVSGQSELPEADYLYARFHGGAAIEVVQNLDVELEFGWRHLLSLGELSRAEWFPRASGAGFDARIGAAYRLGEMFAIHLSLDWRRYFFTLNPVPGDRWVAGGALDQYIGGNLAVSFAWPARDGEAESDPTP